MVKIAEAFKMMTICTENNLGDVQDFIKTMQANKKKQDVDKVGMAYGVNEIAIPKLEPLSQVIEEADNNVDLRILEAEQERLGLSSKKVKEYETAKAPVSDEENKSPMASSPGRRPRDIDSNGSEMNRDSFR